MSIDSRVFAATPPSVPEDGEGRTKASDGDLVPLAGEERAERIDGGRLAHAWCAGDANSDRRAGQRQKLLHQSAGRLLMIAAAALDQRDRAGNDCALARANAPPQIGKIGNGGAITQSHEFALEARPREPLAGRCRTASQCAFHMNFSGITERQT
jgi:hypothetical protein